MMYKLQLRFWTPLLTVIGFLFAVNIAHADQCQIVNLKQAEEAVAILKTTPHTRVLKYCKPCGEFPGESFLVKTVNVKHDERGAMVLINGESVDLAYTFMQVAPAKYVNLAGLVRCPAEDDHILISTDGDGESESVVLFETSSPDFRRYTNERFGCSADVPSLFDKVFLPENHDGALFTDASGKTKFIVSGSYYLHDPEAGLTFRGFFESAKKDFGSNLAYASLGKNTYTVSGIEDGKIHFIKSIISSGKDKILCTLSIEYPLYKRQEFDALINHSAKSLSAVPIFLSGSR